MRFGSLKTLTIVMHNVTCCQYIFNPRDSYEGIRLLEMTENEARIIEDISGEVAKWVENEVMILKTLYPEWTPPKVEAKCMLIGGKRCC